ncbi:MAG TPA: N-methyl-L-tryptophan oxidase [Pirellulales bacterium]|nr:N-methyl-L-tryptophan oxidase [Pirellulales bacterium]
MKTYESIVLGVGGVGSAALDHLARRGVRVLGLDRFPPGHDRGSSHGATRIIRQAYFEHPDYVPLVLRAYDLWDELARRAGQTLFEEVGLLQIGPPGGDVVGGVLASAEAHRLEVDRLSAEQISGRWPGFRVPQALVGVYERRAGFLHVERCVAAHASRAVTAGAVLLTDCTIVSWQADGSGIVVRTDRETFRADALVICAGAWAGQLLTDVGVRFEVRRKPLFWFETLDMAYRKEHCPAFLYELPQGIFYGTPQLDADGVKVAEHSGGDVVADPLDVERQVAENDLAPVEQFVRECLPRAGKRLTRHSVCMYTMSPDAHFVVDRHPLHPQVVFVAGLSGHGFKFTPVLGEIIADLVIDGQTKQPIDFLRRSRFTQSISRQKN